MVKQVLEGTNTPPFPAQQIDPKGRLIWMLDKAAAAKALIVSADRAPAYLGYPSPRS
jgi:hypothetical protein